MQPSFRAFVVDPATPSGRAVTSLGIGDLPAGDVLVRVEWSAVNYKDALAATPTRKVAKAFPLVPGIDLAGEVVESQVPEFSAGMRVVGQGGTVGVDRHGGFAEFARVPAEVLVPIPDALSTRESMALGTAGITAALMVEGLMNLELHRGRGPILVTGARGGVGRIATEILVSLGYETWITSTSVGRPEYLIELGVAGIVSDADLSDESSGMGPERWAGALDVVGERTLPRILAAMRYRGVVLATGNTSGNQLSITTTPFTERAVQLVGVPSMNLPRADRVRLWGRLATDLRPRRALRETPEVTLDQLDEVLTKVLTGSAHSRLVVNVRDQSMS